VPDATSRPPRLTSLFSSLFLRARPLIFRAQRRRIPFALLALLFGKFLERVNVFSMRLLDRRASKHTVRPVPNAFKFEIFFGDEPCAPIGKGLHCAVHFHGDVFGIEIQLELIRVALDDGRRKKHRTALWNQTINRTRHALLAANGFIAFDIVHPFRVYAWIGKQTGNFFGWGVDVDYNNALHWRSLIETLCL